MNRTTVPWIAFGVAMAVPSTDLRSQMVWKNVSPTSSPASRYLHTMAFDTARQRAVMFGGQTMDFRLWPLLYDDTWEYDGTSWTQNTLPFARPPARLNHAMVYDRARSMVVMFGGFDGKNILADTWEYDGVRWHLRAPGTSPPPLSGHRMVYDSKRRVTVLFGGTSSATSRQFSDATWEWDGASWQKRNLANAPTGRINHSMAYDSARAAVVLFGGSDANATGRDTWEWDGTARGWVSMSNGDAPPGTVARMAFDEVRQRVIWFGSQQGANRGLPDLWEWDGITWLRGSASIRPPRVWPALAYDSARRRIVLFSGGNSLELPDDTWEYYPTHRGMASPIGTGCAGSAGIPALGAVGVPIQGNRAFKLRVGSARAGAVAFQVIGRRSADIPVGGCSLRVDTSSDFVVLVGKTDLRGGFVTDTPIPADPGLGGVSVYAQAFVHDDRGAWFGALAVTNGLRVLVGD